MLEESARQFFAERSPPAAVRSNRAAERSFDPDLWQQIAELGFTGALIPEQYGGSGIGYRGLGVVLEAAGRSLAASPLLQSGFITSPHLGYRVINPSFGICSSQKNV